MHYNSEKLYSIIVPTHNRSEHLRRILSYFDGYLKDCDVVIADSSSDDNKKINKKIIESIQDVDIIYFDKYHSGINRFDKFSDAINKIDTKYCGFCADDDFVTANGIKKSVDFLERKPDYSVAHGIYISFWVSKNSKNGRDRFCWSYRYPSASNVSSDEKERFLYHSGRYYPTFYGIHKTELLKMIISEASKNTDDWRFGEILPSMLTVLYGKVKKLDMLYYARERTIAKGPAQKDFKSFMKEGTYDEKYDRFRNCVAVHLARKTYVELEEAKNIVDKGMSLYMENSYKKKPLINTIKSKIGNAFVNYPKAYQALKPLYRKLALKSTESRDNYIHIPPSKYLEDLNMIRSHVLSFESTKM